MSGNILVVDDDPNVVEILTETLKDRGFETESAYDGEEALEKVKTFRPDLILTDFEMPGMDGLELCGRIRSDEKLGEVPILLATAGSIDLSNLNMVNGFMVKPYQKEILFSFIQHLLGEDTKAEDSTPGP